MIFIWCSIRYLGILRKHTEVASVRRYLMVEMLARAIKNIIRASLREAIREMPVKVRDI